MSSSDHRWTRVALWTAVACWAGFAAHAEKDAEVVVGGTGVPPLATAAVDSLPRAIAVTRDESYAYIAHFNADTLSILDLDTLEIIGGLDVADGPRALALSPDNTLLWVANFYSNDVWVVNIVTDTVESRITVNNGPTAVALAPDGGTAYVANEFSGSISVIDEGERAVTNTIWVGGFPQALAVTPDGTRLVVAHGQSGDVDLINLATGERLARQTVAGNPQSVAVVGARVVVAPSAASHLIVLDATTLEEQRRIAVARGPRALAPGPGADEIYVLSGDGRAVTLCDLAAGTVAPYRLTEGRYLAVAHAPRRARLLVTQADPEQVRVWAVLADGSLSGDAPAAPVAPALPEPERAIRPPPVPDAEAPREPTPANAPIEPAPSLPALVAEDLGEPKDVSIVVVEEPAQANAPTPEAGPPAPAPPNLPSPEPPPSSLPTVVNAADSQQELLDAPSGFTGSRKRYPDELQPIAPQIPQEKTAETPPGEPEREAGPAPWGRDETPASRPMRQADVPPPASAPAGAGSNKAATGLVPRVGSLLARVREPLNRLRNRDRAPAGPVGTWGAGEGVVVVNMTQRTLSILDARRSAVVAEIPLPNQPHGVAAAPDGRWIYVADRHRQSILAFRRDNRGRPTAWKLDAAPGALAVSGDGLVLCVAQPDVNRATALDTRTGERLGGVATGEWPRAVALNADGTRAYIANQRGNSVTVYAVETGEAAATWRVGMGPVALALTPDGLRLAVVCSIDDTVEILDTATGETAATVAVGDRPQAIALGPDGRSAFVANFLGSSVTAIDLEAGTVQDTFETERHPSGVAVSASGEYLFVSNRFADSVTVLRLPAGQPVSTVPVGTEPTSLHHLAAGPAG